MEHTEDAPFPQAMEGIVEHVAAAPAVARRRRTGKYTAPAPAVTYVTPTTVCDHVATSPDVAFAALAQAIEYMASAPAVAHTAPAQVSDAAPAPEDEPSPALVAAKRRLVDLRLSGLGEGELCSGLLHGPNVWYVRRAAVKDTGGRTGGMGECWVQPVWGELDENPGRRPKNSASATCAVARSFSTCQLLGVCQL